MLPPTSPARSFSSYRWVVCALLFFATTFNYLDRQLISDASAFVTGVTMPVDGGFTSYCGV